MREGDQNKVSGANERTDERLSHPPSFIIFDCPRTTDCGPCPRYVPPRLELVFYKCTERPDTKAIPAVDYFLRLPPILLIILGLIRFSCEAVKSL